MSPESIFTTVNLIAVAGWLLIAIMPRWKYTRMIVLSGGIPLLLAVAYTIIMVLYFGKAEGGFGSLADVMKLFSNEWAVLAGWIHYLAFDLFVGAWEVKDAQRLTPLGDTLSSADVYARAGRIFDLQHPATISAKGRGKHILDGSHDRRPTT